MDKNLTIVLIIKNFSQYTRRFLGYYNYIKSPYKILIADGGNDQELTKFLENNDAYENLNYQYVKYPFDKTLTEFHSKLGDITKYITTPFCILMSPDDFITDYGLQKSIEFLKVNEDYVSSRGGLYNTTVGNGVYGHLNVSNNIYTQYLNNIDGETGNERNIQQAKYWHGNWHNVLRTKTCKATLKLMDICNPSNMRFTEQLFGFLPAIFGKINRINDYFMLHQMNSAKDSTRVNDFPQYRQWILQNYWTNDFRLMSEIIGISIAYVDNMDPIDGVNNFCDNYMHIPKCIKNRDVIIDKINDSKKIELNEHKVNKSFDYLNSLKMDEIDESFDTIHNILPYNKEIELLKEYLKK